MQYKEIHEEALKKVQTYHQSERELLEVLEKVRDEKVFSKLGYGSLWAYLTLALKLSQAEAGRLSSLMRKIKEIPELREAIQKGELTPSKAGRITSVITPENATRWIEKAKNSTFREIEKEAAKENPKTRLRETITPKAEGISKLSLPISEETEKALRRIQDILSKKKQRNVTLEEVLIEISEEYLNRHDELKKEIHPKPIPIRQERTKTPTWAVRTVSQRDEARCTEYNPDGSRCTETRFTQIHHINFIAHGGTNHPDNLRTICHHHHKKIHHPTG